MREQDFANDQYRPMALINVKAGLDASNNIAAWFYRVVTPSISLQRGGASTKLDSQAVEGATTLPYALGSFITEWIPLEDTVAGIPVGYWRSVGSSINTFAVESMIDMLATAANQDPFDFRRHLISDSRTLAVLEAANTLSAWRLTIPTNHAWGMAISKQFNTIVCEIVEISQPVLGALVIHRVQCVVDCGIAINPDSIEAQMEGAIIHGLNATLWGQATFLNGVAQQTNFNKSRMLRLSEAPTITVTIMPSNNDPSGAGEPGVPPIAPAVVNAYAKLSTGKRVTSLPLFPGTIMGGL
jgi:isoquinoline 1-oxidoreductase beta subunit